MNDTVLEAIRGDHNYFDVDVTGDIDAADTMTFRAGRTPTTLTTIVKTRGAGITDLDLPNGKVQVQLAPADTSGLADDEALLYEVVLHKADVNMDTTVAKGVMRLTS